MHTQPTTDFKLIERLMNMPTYICVVCNNEFNATHKSSICPECKSTPAKCIICGAEFKRVSPYTAKTCSAKCRGIYRKESGVAKQGAAKMKQTKLEKYGSLAPAEVAKQKNGGELAKKICPLCNKEFVPNTPRQVYCTEKHYGPCPVCGKLTEIKENYIGPQACSEECRLQRIYATNLEKYGNKDSVNSEHAKSLAKQHSLEKYGVEYYSQTDEFKERYKATSLAKYGTENPMQNEEVKEKSVQTNLEKYGTEYYSQTDEFKEKFAKTMEERYGGIGIGSEELREKIVATNNEKYGVDFPLQNPEMLEKWKQSNLEKHGTEWPATLPEVAEQRKATNLERYGAENPWGSLEVQERIKAKWTAKYGGPNPMYSKELIEISQKRHEDTMIARYGAHASMLVPELKEKITTTFLERYGVPWYVMTEEINQGNLQRITKPNRQFAKDLEKLGCKCEFEKHIGRFSFDIHVTGTNILVEIDPTWTHNSHTSVWGEDCITPRTYHADKTKLAEENGYRCIHVFDWDIASQILAMLQPKEVIYARKCVLVEVDQATACEFEENYHIQGKCRGQDKIFGLMNGCELVQIMSFGKPRYTSKYDFELLRLCSKHGVEVVGGASRLFSAFTKQHPDASIVSYCDSAKFQGAVYAQIGMHLDHITPPAKVWSKGTEYVRDTYLRQRGYDQIFKTNYGKGTSNEELMLENGWLPVYDCGQKVFTFNIK